MNQEFNNLLTKKNGIEKRRKDITTSRDQQKNYLHAQNRFGILDSEQQTSSKIQNHEIPVKIHIPPIVVDKNHSFTDVQTLLGDPYIYKKTSIGTKVFAESKEDYIKCKEVLLTKCYQFHSFRAKDEQIITIYLYGLPKMDVSLIKEDLSTNNIFPQNIIEIITKHSTKDDAVYRITFLRKTFKISHLKNITTIRKTKIRWKPYKPKGKNETSPTLCWKCLMYGHGGENCHRKMICMTCASPEHPSTECPLLKKNDNTPYYTCFNCLKSGRADTNHRANDTKCPSRLEYIKIRSNNTIYKQKRPNTNNNSFTLQSNEFPPLYHNDTYQNPTQQSNSQSTYAQKLKNSAVNDLYDIDDLFNIFEKALYELNQCKTKSDQIYVIMSLLRKTISQNQNDHYQ